jgi:hypothetical protein
VIGSGFLGPGQCHRRPLAIRTLLPGRAFYARVAKDNVGSIRGREKCGFTVQVRRSGLRMPAQPRSRNWCSNASARASKSKTCPMYHDRLIAPRKESYGACG